MPNEQLHRLQTFIFIGFQRVDDADVPVSYTHLDVYKRQMQTKIDGGKLHYLYDKLKDSPEYQKQFAGKKPDEIAKDPGFNPVSYTHLDVYKRQIR